MIHQKPITRYARAWELLLRLSAEPFTYDNFNVAVDSLDEIHDDLTTNGPGLGWVIVDDRGRLSINATG